MTEPRAVPERRQPDAADPRAIAEKELEMAAAGGRSEYMKAHALTSIAASLVYMNQPKELSEETRARVAKLRDDLRAAVGTGGVE